MHLWNALVLELYFVLFKYICQFFPALFSLWLTEDCLYKHMLLLNMIFGNYLPGSFCRHASLFYNDVDEDGLFIFIFSEVLITFKNS